MRTFYVYAAVLVLLFVGAFAYVALQPGTTADKNARYDLVALVGLPALLYFLVGGGAVWVAWRGLVRRDPTISTMKLALAIVCLLAMIGPGLTALRYLRGMLAEARSAR